MLRAEVDDLGGCNVGTSVLRASALTLAVQFIAQTTKETWAGPWRIIDEASGWTLLRGGQRGRT